MQTLDQHMQIGSEEGNIFMFKLDLKRISNSDKNLFTSSHVARLNRIHLQEEKNIRLEMAPTI